MKTALIHFRQYAQDALNDRYPTLSVKVDKLSLSEEEGVLTYEIKAHIDHKLCIGTGDSQGKAIDAITKAYADYQPEYERVEL